MSYLAFDMEEFFRIIKNAIKKASEVFCRLIYGVAYHSAEIKQIIEGLAVARLWGF